MLVNFVQPCSENTYKHSLVVLRQYNTMASLNMYTSSLTEANNRNIFSKQLGPFNPNPFLLIEVTASCMVEQSDMSPLQQSDSEQYGRNTRSRVL